MISESRAWHMLCDAFMKFVVFMLRVVAGAKQIEKDNDEEHAA